MGGGDENYAQVPNKEDLRYLLNVKNAVKEQVQEPERAPEPPPAQRLLMGAAPGEGRLLPAPPPSATSKEPDSCYQHYTRLVNKNTGNYVEPRSNLKLAHMDRGQPSLTPTNSPHQKSPKLKAKSSLASAWDPARDYPTGPKIIQRKQILQLPRELREWIQATMDFFDYAGEIRCLGVFNQKGPERVMEIIVMTQAVLYQKVLGVDYPKPMVPAWLKDEMSSPVGARVPQIQLPAKSFSGKPPTTPSLLLHFER